MKITINSPNPFLWVEGSDTSLEEATLDRYAAEMTHFTEANGGHIKRMVEQLHRPSYSTFIENEQQRLFFLMMLHTQLVMEHVTEHEDCPWPKLHELMDPIFGLTLEISEFEGHRSGDLEKIEYYLDLITAVIKESKVVNLLEDDREIDVRHDEDYLYDFVHTEEGDRWADILPFMVLIAAFETHLLAERRDDGNANLFVVFGKLAHQYVYDRDSFYMWLTASTIGMHVHRTALRRAAVKHALGLLNVIMGDDEDREEANDEDFIEFVNEVREEMRESQKKRES